MEHDLKRYPRLLAKLLTGPPFPVGCSVQGCISVWGLAHLGRRPSHPHSSTHVCFSLMPFPGAMMLCHFSHLMPVRGTIPQSCSVMACRVIDGSGARKVGMDDGRNSPLFCAGSGQTPDSSSAFTSCKEKAATQASCSGAACSASRDANANEHLSGCNFMKNCDFGMQGLRRPITSLQKLQKTGHTLYLAAERTVADR